MRPHSGAVAAAGTYTTELEFPQKRIKYVTMQGRLVYGTGGTTIKSYLQVSFDEGTTWRDVICLAFALVTASKVSAIGREVAATAAAQAGTDGALADDTIINGLFGPKWRVKTIIVGTYNADCTYRVDVEPDYD